MATNGQYGIESEGEWDSVHEQNDMKTFKDFLAWYNNLDVSPFVTAVIRLQKFLLRQGHRHLQDGRFGSGNRETDAV